MADAAATTAPSAPAPATSTVTLVSGDRVTLRGRQILDVTDARGTSIEYQTRQLGDDLYVMPLDAVPALADDRVDAELFNVTELVAMHYDDAHTARLPLLATYPDQARARAARTPAGATTDRTFPHLRTRALHTSKQQAAGFWKSLSSAADARSADAPKKIWLDGREKALLDKSVPQTGAPEAWAAGYTGKGVKVAVLDTGADATHPDLAGKIEESKDFTGKGDTTDGHGHGTHVASTIAGSGAASDGRYKGMAPDTELLVGKVLADTGAGQDSWILAGMEWAVGQDADIVSMSLGADTAGACDSPLAQAVDDLSAASSSLFVMAAGNAGPGASTVGTPGCARSALTVAAADSDLATASFSSRGDVHNAAGEHWAKPDITAPGVDIVAARATGTSMGTPVDDHYTAASGTSMATPHVAGAAALLAQRHPDWSGRRLKQALTSSVRSGAKDVPLAQGAGFVDVADATRATLTGPAPVDGGTLAWPHTGDQHTARTLTWTNDGDTDVTLHLAADTYDVAGRPAPAGTVTLAADTLTVPAHATASTQVTFSAAPELDEDAYGEITGRITATAGDRHTTTAFGFYDAPHMVDVTIKGTNRAGDPAGLVSYADLLSTERDTVQRAYFGKGQVKFTVRAGTYDLDAALYGYDPGVTEDNLYRTVKSVAAFARPRQHFDSDTVIELDGRTAHRVKVTGERPLESRTAALRYTRTFGDLVYSQSVISGYSGAQDLAVSTTGDAEAWKDAQLGYTTREYAPLLDLRTQDGRRLDALYAAYSATATEGITYLPDAGRADVVDVGSGTADELAAADVKNRVVLVDLGAVDSDSVKRLAAVLTDVKPRGARAVLVTHAFPGAWQPFTATALPVLGIPQEDGDALRTALAKGHKGVHWTGTPASPYVYNLSYVLRPGQRPTFAVRDRELSKVHETWYSQLTKTDVGDSIAVSTVPGLPAANSAILQQLAAPSTRWAYYSTDTNWVHLGTSSSSGTLEIMAGPVRRWSKPGLDTESWYRGPITPGAPYSAVAPDTGALMGVRIGDSVQAALPTFGDADGHYAYPAFNDKVSLTLARDGKPVTGTVSGSQGIWPVASGNARYTLSLTDTRNLAVPGLRDWKLSPTTTTRWDFTSDTTTRTDALPLLVPAYRAPLDTYNRAPATKHYPVVLSAKGQQGYDAEAATLSAEYSSDDGKTWQPAKTLRAGSTVTALVDNTTAREGFVSLRIHATAKDGSEVTQSVVRAYAVR
ncbi:S8 family serine peptidase [Streptomyces sp. NPDC057694]|uniref:S8 family serine peptidase n=1 Tax=Streptomyces sp. NPDC057694 TaxID=3346216 RepID=UPI0036B1427C